MGTMSLYRCIKRHVYRACKAIGLFRLARRATRRGLRILCYHGFSVFDEHDFLPRTFIRAQTFEKRLAYLKKHGFPVLRLNAALELLSRGKLPPCATLITIDDGFASSFSLARAALMRHSFPATVYVTTYYSARERPVFRLAVQYLFWKGIGKESLDLSGLVENNARVAPIAAPEERKACMWEIIHFGERSRNEEERASMLATLGGRLGVDAETLIRTRMFHLMNFREIAEMHSSGIDIQLHTHRHCFPLDEERAKQEIIDNRKALASIVSGPLEHFCYPSGIWSETQWRWLRELGIKSAVTCDPGLNYADGTALALRRFIDGEDVSMIEFEAELCGFSEIMRRIGAALLPGRAHRPAEAADRYYRTTGTAA